jgi:P-type E1-E2 ATPase
LLNRAGIALDALQPRMQALQTAGHTLMLLAENGRVMGGLAVSDAPRSGARAALTALRAAGVRIILATGDHASTAQAIAGQLGLDEVHAGLRPDDKFHLVERLQQEGRRVAMAGDGINDAPALARAQVGIAMGNGTDIAIQSAQVVLLKGDLHGIVRALHLGRATLANIRQNLFFAFAYNFIGVPLAAGAFYPWFGWLLSPMIASAAMSLSSVSVIGNALRLRTLKL